VEDDHPVTRSDEGSQPSFVGSSTSRRSTTTALIRSSSEFLRQQEVSRLHTFSVAILGTLAVGWFVVELLPATVIARRAAEVSLSVLVLCFVGIWWISRSAEAFRPRAMVALAAIASSASVPMAYYFGLASPFPALVSVTFFVYALGAPLRHALLCYALAAGGHGALSALATAGVVEDHGHVSLSALPVTTQVVAQLCVQMVYALAIAVGAASHRSTRRTVGALERAVAQIASREALLREARLELERAGGVGEPGRFTDQELGSYRLGVLLGRGGMGEIYEAHHLETDEPAAVKLLQRGNWSDPDPLSRFEREATMVQSLRSPHVVEVFEVGGAEAPLPYIAMERLRGRDLAWHLRKRRKLPPAEVVELVTQVAEGLEPAREKEVVHRDIKPPNLFRTEVDGAVVWKILDFGVSKLAGEPGTLTAGHLVGTPAYMAPEQASGEGRVDHRADVYALAVIAYRCLTGRPAFSGKDVPAVVHAVVHHLPPRPSSLAKKLPPEVDAVLRVGLAKRASDRFETATELAAALDASMRGSLSDELAERAEVLGRRRAWGSRAG